MAVTARSDARRRAALAAAVRVLSSQDVTVVEALVAFLGAAKPAGPKSGRAVALLKSADLIEHGEPVAIKSRPRRIKAPVR
jgi:hypothetical protein